MAGTKKSHPGKKAKRLRYKSAERNLKRAMKNLMKKNNLDKEQARACVYEGKPCPKM